MKTKKPIIKLIAATLAIVCFSAIAAGKCGIDDLQMNWTGKTMVDGATATLLYELKCINGHLSWAKQP